MDTTQFSCTLGVDRAAPLGECPKGFFRRIENLEVTGDGHLKALPPHRVIKSATSDICLVRRLIATDGNGNSKSYIVYGVKNTLNASPYNWYHVYYYVYDEAIGSVIASFNGGIYAGSRYASIGHAPQAVVAGNVMYITQPFDSYYFDTHAPGSNSGRLYGIYPDANGDITPSGANASFRTAGVDTPTAAPIPTNAGSGNLTTSGSLPGYEWIFSVVDTGNMESAGSPVSAIPLSATLFKANVLCQYSLPAGSTRIQAVRLYRRGGASSVFAHVKDVDIATSGSISITIEDNVADINLGTDIAPIGSAVPPRGFDVVFEHRSRLWGASSYGARECVNARRLWYSTTNAFEVFSSEATDDPTGGGWIDMPGSEQDAILTMSSTGGLLIIGRTSSVYALFGNRADQFVPSQRSNIGVLNRFSMARSLGECYFIGADFRVYVITDKDSVTIDDHIYSETEALIKANPTTASLSYCDGYIVLNISPAYSPWVYDTVNKSGWSQITHLKGSLHSTAQAYISGVKSHEEILFVEPNNAIWGWSKYNPAGDTTIRADTPEIGYSPASPTKVLASVDYAFVDGIFTGTGSATVTVMASGYSRQYNCVMDGEDGCILRQRPHPDLIGRHVSLSLQGTVPSGDMLREMKTGTSMVRAEFM